MTPQNLPDSPTPPASFRMLLQGRNFRLLWTAGLLSAIGDQFDLIAFPWLVLLVTNDPLAVGTVIAIGTIPAVFFMLLGGSLVDRFSPRLIIQISNVARTIIGVLLAILVLTGVTNIWLLYLFAFVKGVADSFYYPAQAAILPSIVPAEQLRQANTVTQTTVEMSGFVGPMLAGGIIAAFGGTSGGGNAPPDAFGVGIAFAVLAATFLLSTILIALMRFAQREAAAMQSAEAQSVWESIRAGIRFVRADTAMFTLFLLIAGIELFIQGPVGVGIPVLANSQLPEGALAVGIISSAFAAGALIGAVTAGVLPAPKRYLGYIFIATYALSGLLVIPFGFLTNTWVGAALVVIIGLMSGYSNILFTTWLQSRTPQAMMGRVMSLLMVASIGLSPISSALSGALIKLSLGWVFVGAGVLMAALSLLGLLRRELRNLTMPT
ncbi:MAG: MFS transporter [Chloroflexota bacterium]